MLFNLFFCFNLYTVFMTCFFFSSRRRHTRWPRDWSSDVCSSDLVALTVCRHRTHCQTSSWSSRRVMGPRRSERLTSPSTHPAEPYSRPHSHAAFRALMPMSAQDRPRPWLI